MGLDTIPTRSNGQPIDQTWFNTIRSVLNGDFVPRDTNGSVLDQAASLGSSAFRWLHGFFSGIYLYNGARSIKLEAPAGITTDFTIKLPNQLPSSGDKMMFVDSTGQSTVTADVDNSTLEIVGSTIRVKDAGVTRAKLAPLGQQISASSGVMVTNATLSNALSVTLTTTGRPIYMALISDGSGNESYGISTTGNLGIFFKRNNANLARNIANSSTTYPISTFWHIDTAAPAGVHTISIDFITSGGGNATLAYAKLIAFEL
jgi:hypothetical protein